MPLVATFEEAASSFPASALKQTIRPARQHKFQHFYKEDDRPEVEKRTTFEFREENLWILDQSWKCWSEFGFVFSPNGDLVLNAFSFPDPNEIIRHLELAKSNAKPAKSQFLDGDVFVFTNAGSRNYFHVVTELVPRLAFLDKFPNSKILISRQSPTFVLEILGLLGFANRIFEMEDDTIYKADRMLVTDWGLNFIPERYKWLSSVLDPKTTSKPERKIYIRRTSGKRTISNALEVEQKFIDRDFEVVDAERLTVKQQIELFSNASHIAGPHGAGFANILWSNKVSILEIRPAGWDNRSLYHHALACCAKNYRVFNAPTIDEAQTMIVDTKKFENHLQGY